MNSQLNIQFLTSNSRIIQVHNIALGKIKKYLFLKIYGSKMIVKSHESLTLYTYIFLYKSRFNKFGELKH